MANNTKNDIWGRREAILSFIKKNKSATREQLQASITNVSKPTLLRDLDFLVSDGQITKHGKTKNAVYSHSRSSLLETFDVNTYFSTPQDERKLICTGFNFDIWNNLKLLLSKKEQLEYSKQNDLYRKKLLEIPPALLKKELERITIELSWKSSQIEGNTYTLLDTEQLIKGGIEVPGKSREEALMILNHKRAIDFIFEAPKTFERLSIAKIEDLHSLLTGELGVKAGIRKRRVAITGTNYLPLDNEFQIKEALNQLVDILNEPTHPLEKALIAVLMISYIQPFEDGNKRTARILGNAILLAHDYCPLSYRSVSETEYKKATLLFYEQNSAYYFKQIFLNQFLFAVENYF